MNGHNHTNEPSESSNPKWSPFSSRTARRKKTNMPLAPADADDPTGHGFVDTIESIIRNGSPVTPGTLAAFWDAFQNQNGVGIDDRKFLLEEILMFLARIPPNSPLSQIGTRTEHYLIDFLYKDLPHPPATFLSPVVHNASALGPQGFAFRTADGSHNNPLVPDLGAAHQPYARSVAASQATPPASLPDPGLIFDTLLRRNKDVDHPTGLSSLFFAFANLIIHSLFRTRPTDTTINDTSGYLDLSPLYGVDAKEQATVRKGDGSGCLWEDAFADRRLLGMAPAVPALLVIFSRNHNFVAKRIRLINEQNKFDRPNMTDDDLRKQDEEIFQRARLVNCGAFMQTIMRDYVGCILHMVPDLTPWHLKALVEMRGSDHEIAPRGEGNVCSVEFNLLYRWHATTSAKDAKWLHGIMEGAAGKDPANFTINDLFQAVGSLMSRLGNEPKNWTFGDLKRTGPDGSGPFSDSDLAKVLHSASADMAQAFRARGIPAAFKIIEIMGIQQAREWGVCSLNEFRKFLGLKPYSSFSAWNPDHDISTAAERLYHHIDNMELYVGMQAEESRPSRPGSGLASGYTMSRSILADAIALIRGDRFLTIEYTPFNLTSWGYQDVASTDDNGSLGGMLPKLLFRALPNHYIPKNVYSHFPFIVPSRMREFLQKNEKMFHQYDYNPPQPREVIQHIRDYDLVKNILSDTTDFLGPYESFALICPNTLGFYFGGSETQSNRRNRKLIEETLFTAEANRHHAAYYYEKTLELIADKSYSPVGSSHKVVDMVREVINYIPLHWIVSHVVDLPLQTTENPDGKYKEEELYGSLAVLFSYIYLNSEPVNAWFLELHAGRAAKHLLEHIREKTKIVSISKLKSMFSKAEHTHPRKTAIQQFCAAGRSEDEHEIISNIFGIIINSAANWSKAMTHVIDFYLDEQRHVERDDIIHCIAGGAQAEANLVGYVREALRLNPPVAGVLREKQGRGPVNICDLNFNHNERVYLNLASAQQDSAHLEEALIPRPQRGRVEPFSFVPGAHSSLDEDFSERTMAQVLRAVFSKKNLRRGPGASGKLAKFIDDFHGTRQPTYIDSNGAATPWPRSLILQYDI